MPSSLSRRASAPDVDAAGDAAVPRVSAVAGKALLNDLVHLALREDWNVARVVRILILLGHVALSGRFPRRRGVWLQARSVAVAGERVPFRHAAVGDHELAIERVRVDGHRYRRVRSVSCIAQRMKNCPVAPSRASASGSRRRSFHREVGTALDEELDQQRARLPDGPPGVEAAQLMASAPGRSRELPRALLGFGRAVAVWIAVALARR